MTDIYKEHSDMVAQLAKPGTDIIAGLNPTTTHLLHMAVGISTEVGEIMEWYLENTWEEASALIEELGDTEFYLKGLCQELGIPDISGINFVSQPERLTHWDQVNTDTLQILIVAAGRILGIVKKLAIYNKPLDELRNSLHHAVFEFRAALDNVYLAFHIDCDEAIRHNLDKLAKRYPGYNYSDTAAQTRADKTQEGN